jgi:uncharacterized protein YggT (Ycf19 family)
MNWIIYSVIGFVVGIMFSSAHPDTAVSINNALYPITDQILHAIKNYLLEILTHA